jgi:hypothetical protein
LKRFTIPKPTWSISSLRLHESHPPASNEELQLLAKRAVLDIRQFDEVKKKQLCQDLGNMLHMMKQVQDFQSTTTTKNFDNVDDPRMLYDISRGVTEAPFRLDDRNTRTSTTAIGRQGQHHSDEEEEVRISKSVRESYLEPKMKRVGGHQYFEIITSIQRTNK